MVAIELLGGSSVTDVLLLEDLDNKNVQKFPPSCKSPLLHSSVHLFLGTFLCWVYPDNVITFVGTSLAST